MNTKFKVVRTGSLTVQSDFFLRSHEAERGIVILCAPPRLQVLFPYEAAAMAGYAAAAGGVEVARGPIYDQDVEDGLELFFRPGAKTKKQPHVCMLFSLGQFLKEADPAFPRMLGAKYSMVEIFLQQSPESDVGKLECMKLIDCFSLAPAIPYWSELLGKPPRELP